MIDVNVDVFAAEGAARRFAENNGLRVSFDVEEGGAPHTDGKTVHVQRLKPGMSRTQVQQWWGHLIHETRHCTERGKKAFKFSKQYNIQPGASLEGSLLNLFEDTCVDNIDRGKYLGMDETVSREKKRTYEDLFEKENVNKFMTSPSSEEEIILSTSLLLDAYVRQSYLPDMIGVYKRWFDDPALHPEIKKRVTEAIKTCSDDFVDLIEGVDKPDSDTKQVWEWEKKYLEDIHNWEVQVPDPPPPEGEEGEEGEGGGEGSPEDEEGKARSKGKGKEGDEPGLAKGLKSFFEENFEVHEPTLARLPRTGDLETVYKKEGYSKSYDPPNANEMWVVDFKNEKFLTAAGGKIPIGDFKEWRQEDRYEKEEYRKYKVRDSLAGEVKRLIQTETRTRIDRHLKKGKLDNTKLYKLGIRNAPQDYKERVFWQKSHKLSVKDTIVSLGCDFSGSMGGEKITTAIHATDLLADVCNCVGVNHEVWGFTCLGPHPTHILFKQFGEKVQRSELVNRMLDSTGHLENNNDGDNVLMAYHRLLAQEASRRIMIVLSDGSPAGPRGDIVWWTKQVIDGILNNRDVELHGIGIRDRSVKRFYPSHSVIESMDELEPALLKVLKNRLVKPMVE